VHLVGFIIRNLTRCTITWTSNSLTWIFCTAHKSWSVLAFDRNVILTHQQGDALALIPFLPGFDSIPQDEKSFQCNYSLSIVWQRNSTQIQESFILTINRYFLHFVLVRLQRATCNNFCLFPCRLLTSIIQASADRHRPKERFALRQSVVHCHDTTGPYVDCGKRRS
jgi:hypothetical protein